MSRINIKSGKLCFVTPPAVVAVPNARKYPKELQNYWRYSKGNVNAEK